MAKKLRVYYDSQGNTLVKDRHGKVIGFEKLNFLPGNHRPVKQLPVEVLVS